MNASDRIAAQIGQALALLANGYKPVPVLRHNAPKTIIQNGKERPNSPGKRPHPELWHNKDAKVYGATDETIKGWRNIRRIGDYPSIGIACGCTVAADCDVYDPDLSAEAERLITERLGETPLRRVGRPPKVLLLYRAATAELNKASTRLFVDDVGTTAQIEIMGHGQQVVVHGLHPDTGSPYAWSEQTPDDTPLTKLPPVTAEQVAALIADAEALFLERGYRLADEPASPGGNGANGHALPAARGALDVMLMATVNNAAMADFAAWVPALFPGKARKTRAGYRIPSAALGRDREEDISITPKGIVDFGEHDMGDARKGRRTPAELVAEHRHCSIDEAAIWLADLVKVELPPKPNGAGHHNPAVPSARDGSVTRATLSAEAEAEDALEREPAEDAPTVPYDELPPGAGQYRPGEAEKQAKVEPTALPEFVLLGDLTLNREVFWLIDETLPRGEMVMIYGPGGSGKTYLAGSTAIGLAMGQWHGREAEPSAILYCAFERPGDAEDRLAAHREEFSLGQLPIALLKLAGYCLDATMATHIIEQAAKLAEMTGRRVHVIIDTVSAALGGNKEDDQGLGMLRTSGERIVAATKGTLFWLHHEGKADHNGPRGHLVLAEACMVWWRVEEREDGSRVVHVDKANRGPSHVPLFAFRLVPFIAGQDVKGRPIQLCALELVELQAALASKRKHRFGSPDAGNAEPGGKVQKLLLYELMRLARKHTEGVEEDILRSAFIAALNASRVKAGEESLTAKRYNQTFKQTLAPMIERGLIERLGNELLLPAGE